MSLFNRGAKPAKSVDAFDRAAGSLYIGAQAETVADAFPDLDDRISSILQTLLFYTRTAIIIGWLKRLEQETHQSKWSELLWAFERLVFPGQPANLPVLVLIRQLNVLLDRGQEMVTDDRPHLRDSPILTKSWCDDWLTLIFDSQEIEIIGPARRLHLSL
jgi:hypothetical protein